jgi:hypothetical protein
LERSSEGALVLDGSYTLSEESALSLLDGASGQPQASAVIDGTVLYVGSVSGEFGVVTDGGLFHRLDRSLVAQDEPSITNVGSSSRLVALGGEAWIMDSNGTRLIRVER